MHKCANHWRRVVALRVSAGTASLIFRQWPANEIRSNGDGMMQFVKLSTGASGQEVS